MPGTTNTGTTHLAIVRMLGHNSSMIGFPLRLLARGKDDMVVQKKRRGQVALVTGEKRTLPPNPRHVLCTIQSTGGWKACQQRQGYRGADGAAACEAGCPRGRAAGRRQAQARLQAKGIESPCRRERCWPTRPVLAAGS